MGSGLETWSTPVPEFTVHSLRNEETIFCPPDQPEPRNFTVEDSCYKNLRAVIDRKLYSAFEPYARAFGLYNTIVLNGEYLVNFREASILQLCDAEEPGETCVFECIPWDPDAPPGDWEDPSQIPWDIILICDFQDGGDGPDELVLKAQFGPKSTGGMLPGHYHEIVSEDRFVWPVIPTIDELSQ